MRFELNGIIGWDVTADMVKDFLSEAGGAEIDLVISSPGGSVFDGIEIFNRLREYKGNISVKIIGIAASMATYIAMISKDVSVYENTVFMIHNPWSFAIGDHNDMARTAETLKALASILARQYSDRSGISKEKVLTMMHEETWLFGQEIIDAGFASTMLKVENPEKVEKEEYIDVARVNFNSMLAKIKSEEKFIDDITKAAACVKQTEPEVKNIVANNLKEESVVMNLKELKEKHPAVYEEAVAEGKTQERSRVKAHMAFISIAPEEVKENIKAGSSIQDDEVFAQYQLAKMSHGHVEAMIEENAENVSVDQTTEKNSQVPESGKEPTDEEVKAFVAGIK